MTTRTARAHADAKSVDIDRRLAAINDGEVLVFGPEGERRAHRLTCKRLPKGDSVQMTAAAAVNLDGATPASCCKPKLPQRRPESVAAIAAELATPIAVVTPPVNPFKGEAPQPATDRMERLALAKAEHKVLQAWIKDGEKPPRPATPNLDAMNAEHAANGGAPRPKAARTSTPRAQATGPYADAMAAKKAAGNKRGPGTKVSADDLAALAAELRAQGMTQAQGLEVAYWLRKLAVSRGTWAKAWEATAA